MTSVMPYDEAEKKRERIAVRLSSQAKSLLERAAFIRGSTVSDFVLNSALTDAMQTIEENERMALTEADRIAFLAALDRPAVPNDALREAAARYRERVEPRE